MKKDKCKRKSVMVREVRNVKRKKETKKKKRKQKYSEDEEESVVL